MLIGLSVSRCVADLIDEIVNIDDVVVIVGRTHFNDESMDALIDGYRFALGPWANYEHGDCKRILEDLWYKGKIHQPRVFGSNPRSVGHGKHWLRLAPEPQDLSTVAQKAYNHYLLLAGLTKNKDNRDDD